MKPCVGLYMVYMLRVGRYGLTTSCWSICIRSKHASKMLERGESADIYVVMSAEKTPCLLYDERAERLRLGEFCES